MVIGNFSGNALEAFKNGKENFIKANKGKYNGDIEALWLLIEKEASVETPKRKKQ